MEDTVTLEEMRDRIAAAWKRCGEIADEEVRRAVRADMNAVRAALEERIDTARERSRRFEARRGKRDRAAYIADYSRGRRHGVAGKDREPNETDAYASGYERGVADAREARRAARDLVPT